MSYIDIFVIAFVALGLLLGLLGRWQGKLIHLLVVVASILIAFFTCGILTKTLMGIDAGFIGGTGSIGDFVSDKIGGFVKDFNIPTDALMGLVSGICKMLVFWLEAIILMLVLGFFAWIIGLIALRKTKKHTAVKTVGLIGAVKGFLISIILIFPVLVFSPILANIGSVIPDGGSTIELIQKQVTTSKVVEVSDKLFNKVELDIFKYEKDGTKGYLYSDIKSLNGLLKLSGLFLNTGEDSNPLETLTSMSDEELREVFTQIGESETVKEVLSGVIEEFIPEDSGIELNIDNIDFSKEADTFVTISHMVEFDEQGEMQFTPENITTEEVAGVLANSDLVLAVVEMVGGDEPILEGFEGAQEIVDKVQDLLEVTSSDDENAQRLETIAKLFGITITY